MKYIDDKIMQIQTYKVKGMHCASCSSIIEKTFKKTAGVQSAEANYGTESVKICFDASKTNARSLSQKIEPLGYSLVIPQTAEEMSMSESEHAEHLGINQSKKRNSPQLLTCE